MHMHMLQWLALKTNSAFLFKGWNTGTITGLVTALLVSIFLALLYEGMSYYGHLQRNITREMENKRSSTDGKSSRIIQHGCRTLSHILQVAIGYILMLCVMTYNIWMLVSVAIGAGIGYFVVRPIVSMFVLRGRGNYYINGEPEMNTLIPILPSSKRGSDCEVEDDGNTNMKMQSYRKTEPSFNSVNGFENQEIEKLLNENRSAKNKYTEKIAEIEKTLNSTVSYKTPKRLEGLLRETDSLKAIRSYKADDSDISKVSELNESYLGRSYNSRMSKQNESKLCNTEETDKSSSAEDEPRSTVESHSECSYDKYELKVSASGNIRVNASEVTIIERDSENMSQNNLWNRYC